MSIRSILDLTCDLQYETTTHVGGGRFSPAWSDRIRGMPCSIQPASAQDVLAYRKIQARVSHRVYCETVQPTAPGTNLNTVGEMVRSRKKHRVVLRKGNQTRRFMVAGVKDVAEKDRLTIIMCEEKENAFWND